MGSPNVRGYHLQRCIGYSPLGRLYVAKSAQDNRLYAVKVLDSELVSSDIDRTALKATYDRIAAMMPHPVLAPTLDLLVENNDVYVVSALDDGISLQSVLRRLELQNRRLAPQDVLAVLTVAESALEALHENGEIHANLKPSNIRMSRAKTPQKADILRMRVSDYIFSSLIAAHQPMRRQMEAAIYAAPEQFQGNCSASSDQYALAAVLYRCLAGCTPFVPRSILSVIRQKSDTEILAVRAPNIHPDVIAVLRRAMDPAPEARYPTLWEFRHQLREALKSVAQDADPLGSASNSLRIGRREVLIGAAASSAVFLFVGLFHSPFTKVGAFAAKSASAPSPPVSAFERIWSVQAHQRGPTVVSWSLDGTRLATGGGDGAVRIWTPLQANATTPLTTISVAGTANGVSWAPDGSVIAIADSTGAVSLVKTLDGNTLTRKYLNASAYGVAWYPDGSRFIGGAASGHVIVWDARSHSQLLYLSDAHQRINALDVSSDGRWIAGACDDKFVYIWDAQSGVLAARLEGTSHEAYTVAFSPDGQRVAASGADERLWLWNTDGMRLIGAFPAEQQAPVQTLSWSLDGQALAMSSLDGTVALHNLGAATHDISLLTVGFPVWGLDWRRHPRTLAVGGNNGMAAVWNIRAGSAI